MIYTVLITNLIDRWIKFVKDGSVELSNINYYDNNNFAKPSYSGYSGYNMHTRTVL